MSESNIPSLDENPTKAVRLTFSFQGDQVQLISQQSVEMTLPPSDPVHGTGNHKGFWADLRDAQDRPLYRRVMHNPMRADVEVFSDDPQRSVARQAVPQRQGVFVLLVPETEAGQTVALFSSPQPSPGTTGASAFAVTQQPAKEIARFTLQKN